MTHGIVDLTRSSGSVSKNSSSLLAPHHFTVNGTSARAIFTVAYRATVSFTCRRLSRWQVGKRWVSRRVLNEPSELLTGVTAVYSPLEAPVTVEWDYVKALLHVCPQIRLSTDRFSRRGFPTLQNESAGVKFVARMSLSQGTHGGDLRRSSFTATK